MQYIKQFGILALAGAGMTASFVSEPLAKLAAPLLSARIEEKVRDALAQQAGEISLPEALTELPQRLGLDEAAWRPLAERIQRRKDHKGHLFGLTPVGTEEKTYA